jgi:polysaccharide export outer membrane protein
VGLNDYHLPDRWITGVDGQRVNPNREPRWRDARPVPWESLSYGEYIGPPRTPHLPEYRVLIGDQIDFIFRRKRSLTPSAYRFGIGDVLAVSALSVDEFQEFEQTIQLDGTIQVRGIGSVMAVNKTIAELQDDINRLAVEVGGIKESPEVMVKPVNTETNLQDLIRTVDATAGLGGLSRSVIVSPDGTIQLPGIGVLPALGLSLTELQNEANARYREEVDGLEVTAILTVRAPRFVYVMGEVRQAGRVELTGPTTLMQAIAQSNGWGSGANLRHIVVLRRDKNWQLVATKVDLSGALWGHRPNPSDDMWLRHSDIILVPKNPGQRLADFIEVYFGRGLYGIFPTQGFAVNFDGVSRL